MNPLVVFVGDKASNKNLHPAIPFLGTQSGKRLVEWLKYLDYTPVAIINQAQEGFDDYVRNRDPYVRFIALGKEAQKRLDKHHIDSFIMPHPSGRNRQLNDKSFVDRKLQECYIYLHGKAKS